MPKAENLEDGTESYGRPMPKDIKEFYELSELLGVKEQYTKEY